MGSEASSAAKATGTVGCSTAAAIATASAVAAAMLESAEVASDTVG